MSESKQIHSESETSYLVEWRHRSMTFFRGGCGANTRLHPVGQDIRTYAGQLDNGATHE